MHEPRRKSDRWRAAARAITAALAVGLVSADSQASDTAPRRVVSMNLCTDQLALLLAAPDQIHSVSNLSQDPATSPLARQARRYQPNHGLAEEVFLMRPDLVLAGAYTRRQTTELLTRLGFRVEVFAPASSFEDIRANLRRLGRLLGREARAARLIAAFDASFDRRRAAVSVSAPRRPLAALYYANSYTSGRGTLAADILSHARLENLATSLGLGGIVRLPLELIVFAGPDLLITGDAGDHRTARAGAALAHPALRHSQGRTVAMDNRWACGTPAVLDIVRELEAVVLDKPARAAPRRSGSG